VIKKNTKPPFIF